MSVTVIPDIEGKIVSRVIGAEAGSEYIIVVFEDGKALSFYHEQDCCENVTVNDVIGDFSDFIGQPITSVEERSEENENDYGHETWTFYEFTCPKGTVTVRWLGESNGYYSEAVDWKISGPVEDGDTETIRTGDKVRFYDGTTGIAKYADTGAIIELDNGELVWNYNWRKENNNG